MTMWDYLDRHPWWALLFLTMIAGALVAVAEGRRK